MKSSRS
ncbi:unnamed protein product, partial [Allacma fusca]